MTTWAEPMKDEGRTEGRAGTLVSMARQRFGNAAASTMTAPLGRVASEAVLKEPGTYLLTRENGAALIAKVRQI